MIISRTPLRLSFVGGGSDLPSYYRNFGGSVISSAINRYVYINLHDSFDSQVRVAYSKVESVQKFSNVKHSLVRNCANLMQLDAGIEITSIADIPATGTGLGSSSSFTVGLLNCMHSYLGQTVSAEILADKACQVEINLCKEPIGKQDQYAAAYGGMNIFNFNPDETVKTETIYLKKDVEKMLFQNLLIFYTGGTRSASEILNDQNIKNQTSRNDKLLQKMVGLVNPFKSAVMNKDLATCGEILHENWMLKKNLASSITNSSIDSIYESAISAGALGGKLLGAGGSGFMIFLVEPKNHDSVTAALSKLRREHWEIDHLGTTIVYRS